MKKVILVVYSIVVVAMLFEVSFRVFIPQMIVSILDLKLVSYSDESIIHSPNGSYSFSRYAPSYEMAGGNYSIIVRRKNMGVSYNVGVYSIPDYCTRIEINNEGILNNGYNIDDSRYYNYEKFYTSRKELFLGLARLFLWEKFGIRTKWK